MPAFAPVNPRSPSRILIITCVVLVAAAATSSAAALRGTITDPDGRPVRGVGIALVHASRPVAAAVTGPDGRFRLDRLQAGHYEVVITHEYLCADPIGIDLDPDADRELTISLRLAAISESIVVTASQVEMPLSRAADSITVLSRADLETLQVPTVADALRLAAGVSVTRSGSLGGNVSLFPRGGESDYTLVLVDGIKVNAFGGGFDFSQLAAGAVDRIEVVRGSQSAVFGSDAIGGVIHVVTRRGGPTAASGVAETGGQGTTRFAVNAGGTAGPWRLGGSVEQLDSDGFNGARTTGGETVANDHSRFRDAGVNADWQDTRGTEVRLTVRAGSNDRGFPGPFGSDPAGAFPGIDRTSRGRTSNIQAGARLGVPLGGSTSGARQVFQASYQRSTSDFTSLWGLSASGSEHLSARTQIDWAASSALGLSAGLEAQSEKATSTFITGATSTPVPVRRLVVGYFGEGRYQPGQRLAVSAGLRLEQIRRDRLEPSTDLYTPRPAFGTDSMISVNPRLSVGYVIRTPAPTAGRPWFGATRVRGAAGTGIRPPDALEIAFTDNPNLKPERSRSAEIALAQELAGGAARFELTVFANRYDDLIVAVGRAMADASRYRTDNIANASARGVELSAVGRMAAGLSIRGAYTWLQTEVRAVDGVPGQAPPPFQVGDPLLRRPRHQASVDLAFSRARITVFGQVGARGRSLDLEPNWGAFGGLFFNPGYVTANAGATVRIRRQVEVLMRVNNLLDRHYEEALGYPAPGRTGTVGVRVAVGR